ncbi:glutathione S-transferase [Aureobasidium pullulans]|nr:glutathione S-transferase [Aureobasidium pullulans]
MSNNIKPLILHAHAKGPDPYKVAAVLEALNLPYNVRLWTFASDSHGVKGPEFLAINPNGRTQTPTLPARKAWLASTTFSATMTPMTNSRGRQSGDFDQWTSFLISTMGPMIGQCNWFRHYNAVKNDDAYKRCFGVLEVQLKSHEGGWVIAGENHSVVDLHFKPWIRQYGYAGLSLDEYPKIKAWLDMVQGLPEVIKAYEMVKAREEA